VPDANRFKINGRPVILIWTLDLGLFSNTQGNASKLIAYVRQQCEADYGFNPYIIVSDEFPENDTTCTNAIIDTDEAWFNPWLTSPPVYSWTLKQYVNSASQTISTGVCVAQYNEVNSALGLDGVIDPNHGVTLQTGLQKTADLHYPDEVTFIEGFSDWEENAAIWRVNNLDSSGNALTYATTYYDYPNQRIEVLRQHAKNLFPIDLKMDAVSCDSFSGWSGTPSNYYRNGAISNSISPTTDTTGGYYVSMTAGQTLQWSEAQNAQNNPNFWGIPINGTVHINVRVATNNATSQLYFVIDGTTYSTVTLPNTGGLTTFATVSMGSYALAANSYHVVQLVCPTGTVNLHYWQLAP